MSEASGKAAHLPAFFNVTIFELGKHAEWGATVGRRLLNGELERMMPLLTDSYMTRVLGRDWQSVVAKVMQGPPTFTGRIRADPSKHGPKGNED